MPAKIVHLYFSQVAKFQEDEQKREEAASVSVRTDEGDFDENMSDAGDINSFMAWLINRLIWVPSEQVVHIILTRHV